MSRKKDENNATVIIFLFILVCCALAFGWVVGSIIAVFSLIAMCMGEISSKDNKKTNKPKTIQHINKEYKQKEETKKKQQLEKEMDNYGLSEEEKKLVRSGEYDPWQFEEEDMDEDDYYSEDE